ncbi:hypothetical protein [Rhodococcus koreensis]|uniref:hypothetical protein n=1 Tax=Rhodococcus koreensis TaxID=99653 RepID=UPI001980F4F9|nr:hypothetical protein [Rhodococcus koreensis]QSE84085.1 hypothetical protein JWS14_35550 [Rhodococcus koreensis]
MAVIVYSSNTKYSIEKGAFATVSEGHLFVYESGNGIPRDVVAVFAPGLWERFVRDGSVVRSKSGNTATLTGDVVAATS